MVPKHVQRPYLCRSMAGRRGQRSENRRTSSAFAATPKVSKQANPFCTRWAFHGNSAIRRQALSCTCTLDIQDLQMTGVMVQLTMTIPYLMVWPSFKLRSCFLYSVAASDCAIEGAIALPDAAELAATLTSCALCACFS